MFFLFLISMIACFVVMYKPHLFGLQDSNEKVYVFFIPFFIAVSSIGPELGFGYVLFSALLTLFLMFLFIILHALVDFFLRRVVRFRLIKRWAYMFAVSLASFVLYILVVGDLDDSKESDYLSLSDKESEHFTLSNILPGMDPSRYTGKIVKGRCNHPSILSTSQSNTSIYCEHGNVIVNLVYSGGGVDLRDREYFDFEGVVRNYEYRGGVVFVEIEF